MDFVGPNDQPRRPDPSLCWLDREIRERAEDLEAQVKERDVLVEELVLSNQAQLERNETLTVQNEDLRGEFNEAVRAIDSKLI